MAELSGQIVVLIGGSAGIGLETARRAKAEGAEVILTGRNVDRLERAASEVGAKSAAAFDATDTDALKKFFGDLQTPIDHVLVTAGGPSYVPLLEMTAAQVRDALSDHVVLDLEVARAAAGFVDTPLSATLLGEGLEQRRNELRATLPIRRVVTAVDVAKLAVHLMVNTALTGATYDIDGGQQFTA